MTIINVADAGLHGVGMSGQCGQSTCGQDQPFQGRCPHTRQRLHGPILRLHQKVTLLFILLHYLCYEKRKYIYIYIWEHHNIITLINAYLNY